MVCLRNICINTLHKEEDDNDDNSNDDNIHSNNNNKFVIIIICNRSKISKVFSRLHQFKIAELDWHGQVLLSHDSAYFVP